MTWNGTKGIQQNKEYSKEGQDNEALVIIDKSRAPKAGPQRFTENILLTSRTLYSRLRLTCNFGRATHTPARQVLGLGLDRDASGR